VHYQKNGENWVRSMDSANSESFPIFAEISGAYQAKPWWIRSRIFFIACAELWGFRSGSEWMVWEHLLAGP
jgi:cyclopropane-fatty-acyl-phospholipid synthase